MLRLTPHDARPGMVLDMSVTHPTNPSVVLLRAGVALEQRSIDRLREIGVREMWIRCPALKELAKFTDARVLGSQRDLVTNVASALEGVGANHLRLDYQSYKRAVMSVIEQLAARPRAALFLSEIAGGSTPALRHAGNVAFLSLLMGLKLDFYLIRQRSRLPAMAARDLSSLGVGAMLHDVGMMRLSPGTLDKWNTTHDESDPAWREHATLGFEMVKGELDPAAAGVVLHHHQHMDGSGFPNRCQLSGVCHPLSGHDIHVFARITGCADLFDRLRHPAHAPGADETLTPSIPAVRAYKMLLGEPYNAWVDPVVFRALLAVAPPYAPGSIVTITGERRGVVVGWSPKDPCRPTVQVLNSLDDIGNPRAKPGPRIDLSKETDVQVVEAEGFGVSNDNFQPRNPADFELNANLDNPMPLLAA